MHIQYSETAAWSIEADVRRRHVWTFRPYRIAYEYLDKIGVQLPPLGGVSPEPIGRYNVAPQSKVQLLHQDEDGLRMELVSWRYAPFWAKGKRPPAINARVETAATREFFRDVWQTGRAIVPADGWYEWNHYLARALPGII